MSYNPSMYAKRFESLLAGEVRKTDLSQRAPDDMPQRFESLRGYGLLPAGRTKNVTPLSLPQMVTAILAIATVKPGYAGHAGKTLSSLGPVGGTEASFQKCATLGSAVECLLQNPAALDSILELRVSDSEIYTNAHGRGAIIYRAGDTILTAHYVHQNALSLFQAGAEKEFNSRDLISSVVTEMVFYPPNVLTMGVRLTSPKLKIELRKESRLDSALHPTPARTPALPARAGRRSVPARS